MGATNVFRTYETTDKAAIRKRFASDCETARYEDGNDPYSGSIGQKRSIGAWRDQPTSFEDAHEWILKRSEKWDSAAAAAAYYLAAKTTDRDRARIEKAEKKVGDLLQKHRALVAQVEGALKGAKSKQVGCKGCGSKITRSYLKGTSCPVCGGDLLSTTARGRIDASTAKVEAARKALAEARQPKLSKKVGYVVGGWAAE